MIVVLLGAPGAGKGTQAQMLVKQYGMVHLSSGNLLNEERKLGTELGVLAAAYMDRGEYVPDSVMIDMILSRVVVNSDRSIILDGFPRTVAQAEALDAALAAKGQRIDAVPYIKVEREALLDRLGGRYICKAASHSYHIIYNPPRVVGICDIDGSKLYQRPDDSRETAEKRLVVFEKTIPVVDYYRSHGALQEIDGEADIEEVSRRLVQLLGLEQPTN